MRHIRTLILAVLGLTILLGSGLPGAAAADAATAVHAVFVQTNDPSANAVRVYDRASDGKLSFVASYATGGGHPPQVAGSVSSYVLNANGTLTTVSAAVANGQDATCWDAFSRGFLYAVNTASSTISGYADTQGSLSLLDPSGVTARTHRSPIDVAFSGGYLYMEESLTGTLGEFTVASNGSLTRIGTITGLPVFSNGNGMEGIAAT
jgi:hypothetical protein